MNEALYCQGLYFAKRVCPQDDRIDPEDILHSALVRSLPRLAALPNDGERIRYLNTAIANAAIDYRRACHRHPTCQLSDNVPAGDVADEALTNVALEEALSLTTPARLLNAMGWSLREAAIMLGHNVEAVKAADQRWRRRHHSERVA